MKKTSNFPHTAEDENQIITFLKGLASDAIGKVQTHVVDKAKDLFKNNFQLLKIYWNYEEKSTPSYTFQEVVSWLKTNLLLNKDHYGGVYYFPPNEKNIIILHVFFLDGNRPLIDGTAPHLLINTLEIDEDLKNMFKANPLLIIK